MLMKEILGDMFRKGDVVVCIVDESKDAIKTGLLTLNKCYTVEWEDPFTIYLENLVWGGKIPWNKNRFISLKELRTQKLNKILCLKSVI